MTPADWVAIIAIDIPAFLIGMVLGPAFNNVVDTGRDNARSLADVLKLAATRSQRPGAVSTARTAPSSETTDGDRVTLGLLGGFAAVVLYVAYREVVLIALLTLASVIAIFATLSFVLMSRRGVVSGRSGVAVSMTAIYLASLVGFVTVVLLWISPAATAEVQAVYAARSVGAGGLTAIIAIAYQLLGGSAYAVLAFFSISASISVMSALNIAAGAWGQPLWQILHRYTRFALRKTALLVGAVLGALAIIAGGGWLYEWVSTAPPFTPFPSSTP